MWIRIDCIRIQIHKIWIQIQVSKITKFSKHLLILKVKKTLYFQGPLNLLFLGSDLINNSSEKKIFLLVKLCFSLYFISDFIPLDPRTQMNLDPTGSGSASTSLLLSINAQDSQKKYVLAKATQFCNASSYVKFC